ncbi:hypothetical protein E3N88_25598 [Mikania micrantha]|uniref:Uncharacterized protein n=1 Tax=Mikania micrantha TaxID=192012 RepID=A0A5N6N6T3_9ASTR|nr:hypothetical protein E3N88_25598 [Mikania micrantha]
MKHLKLLDIKSSFRRLRKHAYDCKSVYGFREMKGGREKLWGLDLSRILAGSEPSFRQRLGILAEKLKKRWRDGILGYLMEKLIVMEACNRIRSRHVPVYSAPMDIDQ